MASGAIPPGLWNKLGTRLIPKLGSGKVVSLQVQTLKASSYDRRKEGSLEDAQFGEKPGASIRARLGGVQCLFS